MVSGHGIPPWNVFLRPQWSLYGDGGRNWPGKWLAPGVNVADTGLYLKMSLTGHLRVPYRIGGQLVPARVQKLVKTAHVCMFGGHRTASSGHQVGTGLGQ